MQVIENFVTITTLNSLLVFSCGWGPCFVVDVVVVFLTSLDCYRFVFTILERFTRSNDAFEGLTTFGLIGTICIFLFCPDRLVCLNKSINASLLLNICIYIFVS